MLIWGISFSLRRARAGAFLLSFCFTFWVVRVEGVESQDDPSLCTQRVARLVLSQKHRRCCTEVEVEKPSLILVVIVPASSLLNTKLGVLSVVGVEMAVTAAKVGAVVSTVTLPVPLVTVVPELEDVSEKVIEYATAPSVSADATV